MVKVRYDPENGFKKGEYSADATLYTAWVQSIFNAQLQMLGSVEKGYLVICGLNGKAYFLQRNGYLAVSYIMEKFDLKQTDAENFQVLITEMTERTRL